VTQVVLGENESGLIWLYGDLCQVSRYLADVRKHQHFETPLEKRKRKAIAARKQAFQQDKATLYL